MAEKTGKRVRVFFLEGEWVFYSQKDIDKLPEEVYDVLHRDSERQLIHMRRDGRCQVPGKRGKMIRCPEKNKCEKCPYGIVYQGDSEYVQPGEQTGRPLSGMLY